MMKLVRGCFVLLAMLPAVVRAEQSINVAPLTRDGRVFVSFRLSDAFNDDVRTAIHSGLSITFVYAVELKRASTMWLDRTIAAATITAAVRYDNLTRKYHVTRKEDGRVEQVQVIDSEEATRQLLTGFQKLPLFNSSILEPNGEYYIRVRAHTTPRNASFVLPWQSSDVVGQAKFTFIR